MSLYSDPPPLHTFSEDKPILLVCWWVTIFCTAIILFRVAGRFIRSEELFSEDRAAALALIPLYLRMGCVHVILVYGTNNAQLAGAGLSNEELHQKSVASGLVLLSRILYAATLWILKNTILEFFKRLNANWERTYELTLLFIRCSLVATFIAIVISDLAECQPFHHYWQTLPDPGGQCRQGYANLVTTATCNVLTDLMLVIFPIPIILRSSLNWKRKVQLILLFSLSLAVVATTLYRVPKIIEAHGSQPTRSLYASVELIFATTAANALVLVSFVRDRGVKKRKWKYVTGASRGQPSMYGSRRPALNQHWGSDEDLARDTGYGVTRDLRHEPESSVTTRMFRAPTSTKLNSDLSLSQTPEQKRFSYARSDGPLLADEQLLSSRSNDVKTPRRVSFCGLLEDRIVPSYQNGNDADAASFHTVSSPSPSVLASATGLRRGSMAFLQGFGGLSPSGGSSSMPPSRRRKNGGSESLDTNQERPRPDSSDPPSLSHAHTRSPSNAENTVAERVERSGPVLMDAGGLLDSS